MALGGGESARKVPRGRMKMNVWNNKKGEKRGKIGVGT